MSVKGWWERITQMGDAEAERWAVTRERGRWRFIIRNGVLIFAVCGGIIVTVLSYLLDVGEGPLWGRLALRLALAPLAGIWFGSWEWTRTVRRYLASRERSIDRTHA